MTDKKNPLYYCATDKEIFDVLKSAKQRLTEHVLLELAKDKGIFYSANEDRDDLAEKISLLPHDYYDLNVLLSRREQNNRSDKIKSETLNGSLTIEEIKEIAKEFQESPEEDEKVKIVQDGNKITVKIEYSDLNYAKSRLMQRIKKEADIEFEVNSKNTILRFPANSKGESIAKKTNKQDRRKKKEIIPILKIELIDISGHLAKTEFFTRLITSLPGFRLSNVTNIKVESSHTKNNLPSDDEEEADISDEARDEMLGVVKNAALRGESLLSSKQYQDLKNGGFYIASIVWRSDKTSGKRERVEFFAGFEKPETGEGFKFSIKGYYNFSSLEYTKSIRSFKDDEKREYIALIEQTAQIVIHNLKTEQTSYTNGSQKEDEQ
ncbi:hypothetical protein C4J88_1944 [Pseudomonas sp. R4-39-08]|uniref:hypothetical protein n=1 Tax=Pseudomonas sp. R4-39-08 TaxID=1173288 RepID=UPI000F560AD4|nr:hypothetical protein [Pseudomonas sp. R4-39-08]AZF36727.1 hypothetical protein C4J88_1944 [Pseudomonas sp. R4-39-08]